MGSLSSKCTASAPDQSVIRGPYDVKDTTTLPPCGPCVLTRCGTRTGMCICYKCWTAYRVHSLCDYPPDSERYEWPHKHVKWPELPDGLYMHF
ncbi:hypothetical protein CspHIS471_0608470 [Cutaneotrichosporon sp. HIS471]|nr:hypothetical protein CspHIS471_0608470 [Cutaneotrichosporon sp. HIS471]